MSIFTVIERNLKIMTYQVGFMSVVYVNALNRREYSEIMEERKMGKRY